MLDKEAELMSLHAALRNAGRALASLDEESLGFIYGFDSTTGEPIPVGSVRDALVDEIIELVGPLKVD